MNSRGKVTLYITKPNFVTFLFNQLCLPPNFLPLLQPALSFPRNHLPCQPPTPCFWIHLLVSPPPRLLRISAPIPSLVPKAVQKPCASLTALSKGKACPVLRWSVPLHVSCLCHPSLLPVTTMSVSQLPPAWCTTKGTDCLLQL